MSRLTPYVALVLGGFLLFPSCVPPRVGGNQPNNAPSATSAPQTSSVNENEILERWLNAIRIELTLSSEQRRSIQNNFRLELERGSAENFAVGLPSLLNFARVVRDSSARFPTQINFVFSESRYPPQFDASFQDRAVGLLLISRVNGVPLFDKIISMSSFLLNENPAHISVAVLMNPQTVYNFNWGNLHTSIESSPYSTNLYARDYFSVNGFEWANVGTIVEGEVDIADSIGDSNDALIKHVRQQILSRLRSEHNGLSIQEANTYQIEISCARNLITFNDNHWEILWLTLCNVQRVENGNSSYRILLDGAHYDAGKVCPEKNVLKRNGNAFEPIYTASASSFVRGLMQRIESKK